MDTRTRPSWLACINREHRQQWWVNVRNANHSTFNGGRRTPSAYSEVHCPVCRCTWRTRAAYVGTLPDRTQLGPKGAEHNA